MNINESIRSVLESSSGPGEGWYGPIRGQWAKPPRSPFGPKPISAWLSYDIDGKVISSKFKLNKLNWVRGTGAFYWGYSVMIETVEGWRVWGTIGSVKREEDRGSLPSVEPGVRLRLRDLVVEPWREGVWRPKMPTQLLKVGSQKMHGVITTQSRPTVVRIAEWVDRYPYTEDPMRRDGWSFVIQRDGRWVGI
jgi:hypothetical protein